MRFAVRTKRFAVRRFVFLSPGYSLGLAVVENDV